MERTKARGEVLAVGCFDRLPTSTLNSKDKLQDSIEHINYKPFEVRAPCTACAWLSVHSS